MQEYRCLNCGNVWASGHPATQEPEKDVPSCPECKETPAGQCDGPCHDPVNYHFYSTDRGWKFCPWCGLPLGKEASP